MLTQYLKTYLTSDPTIPTIMNEEAALSCVRAFCGLHITELEECISGSIPNLYLYQREEDKKHLSITDIRRWIDDISEKPYEGKAMYLLRDFDGATSDAMNACLKVLEEPPEYAIIILIVSNPESIIETIRSRTVTFFTNTKRPPLSAEYTHAIAKYFSGDIAPLLSLLYKGVADIDEAINILVESIRYADEHFSRVIEASLVHLFYTNETPKNILDGVFFSRESEAYVKAR